MSLYVAVHIVSSCNRKNAELVYFAGTLCEEAECLFSCSVVVLAVAISSICRQAFKSSEEGL